MKITIADNKKLETHSIPTKLIRLFTVPLLNNLPSSFIKKIMRSTSNDAIIVIENVGSARALEVMYTRYNRNLFARGFWRGIGNLFWHNFVSQSKALRNRLRIVEEKVENEILQLCNKKSTNQKDGVINILTVGGGSCRAIIQSISKLSKEVQNCKIEVTNIDKSQKAIELGKELAKNYNVSERFKWINTTASNIKSLILPKSIDIVEMVGLLDYFPDEKAVEIMGYIYKCLKNDGLFITGNIYPNSETPFISKIGWPKMYYRKKEDLSRIFKKSGFSLEKGEVIFEPLKSHIVAQIKK